ncbi:MAG: hypothetical protein J6P66_07870 [Bacteroidaceae bacterium]|nr:hypothetical protein [Bacteroidaceae bacterium]
MPKFHPTPLIQDCWSSIGNITFFHRNGQCYYKRKPYTHYQAPPPSWTKLSSTTAPSSPGSSCLTPSSCSGESLPSPFRPIVHRMTTITTSAATISLSLPITASPSSAVNTYLNRNHSQSFHQQHWNSCR